MNKKTISLIIIVVVVLVAWMLVAKKPATVEKIKVGYISNLLSSATVNIAQDKKLFEAEGLVVELVPMVSTNEIYEALVRGDIDYVPSIGILPILLNEPKVGGVVKIASVSSFVPGVTFDKLITLNPNIKTLKDLENKKIAVFPGTTPTTFLKLFLKKNNVNVDSITYVQTPPQNQGPALKAGSVDALFGYEPVPSLIEAGESGATVLARDLIADVYNESPLGARGAGAKFMCERPEDFAKMQKVIDQAQDIIRNDKDAYIQIISRDMNIPVTVLEKIYPYFTQPVDRDDLVVFEDFLIKNGELTTKTNMDSLISCK